MREPLGPLRLGFGEHHDHRHSDRDALETMAQAIFILFIYLQKRIVSRPVRRLRRDPL